MCEIFPISTKSGSLSPPDDYAEPPLNPNIDYERNLIGDVLNEKYKIVKKIGDGSFSVVYLVYDETDKKKYLTCRKSFKSISFLSITNSN